LEELILHDGDRDEIRKVSDYIDELLYREEMLWLQRSRIAWLKEGDRNPKYFPQKAVWRARKNKVKKLKDGLGVWQDAPSEMERMANSFFKELFTRDPSVDGQEVIGILTNKVSDDMNDMLTREFTDEEISDQMRCSKLGLLRRQDRTVFRHAFIRGIGLF
jgi:hypothetical protein